jgi:hypothetical protein
LRKVSLALPTANKIRAVSEKSAASAVVGSTAMMAGSGAAPMVSGIHGCLLFSRLVRDDVIRQAPSRQVDKRCMVEPLRQ